MHLSRRHPDNYELLAAALLHDVVEDCGVSLDELFKLFGAGVAILVWEVSHPETPPGMPRRERWPIYLEHFASASVNGQTLKLADRYRNLREYVDFWDSLPEKERKFIRGVYRKETIELIDRIGGVDKETTAKIIDTMMEIMGNLR
jgi:(p)ppGpp synthase/HD superfamily hydrolase